MVFYSIHLRYMILYKLILKKHINFVFRKALYILSLYNEIFPMTYIFQILHFSKNIMIKVSKTSLKYFKVPF